MKEARRQALAWATTGMLLVVFVCGLVSGGLLWVFGLEEARGDLEAVGRLLSASSLTDAELAALAARSGVYLVLEEEGGRVLAFPREARGSEEEIARIRQHLAPGEDFGVRAGWGTPWEAFLVRRSPRGTFYLVAPLGRLKRALVLLGCSFFAVLFLACGLGVLAVSRFWRLARHLVEETAACAARLFQGEAEPGAFPWDEEVFPMGRALAEAASVLRKKMKELEESKHRLEVLLAHMNSGVILVDRHGRVGLVNPAAEFFLGIRGADVTGKTHVEAVKNYQLSSLIADVLASGEPRDAEVSLIFPRERILQVHSAPIPGKGREVRGVVVVFHDISEIRRLERLRAEFVANVSHELKTPVTTLKGFAETLLQGALYNYRAAEEFVQIIHEEAERLSRLVCDLLELSRLESREARMHLEELDLGAEVRRIAEKLLPQFQKKGLRLQVVSPEKRLFAWADRDRFEQVLLNLLDNSLKYTPPGGQVAVCFQEEPEEIVISVRDTGIGIPEEDLPRIFERFYRVDKARSRKLGGTGLGLAIVKHIVEAHGGRVGVESKPGEGSTFFFTLPRASS